MKKRIHFTDNYLLDPQHPISIILIGAGGTGSQVLTALARLNVTLQALGHPGLYVTTFDPDNVSETNLGRQLFSPSELGLNKAECLTTRINHFFGTGWEAVPQLFPNKIRFTTSDNIANIFITCTDNIQSRIDLSNTLKKIPVANYIDYSTPLYWLDFGNTQTTGQVILGTINKIIQPKSKLYKTVDSLKSVTDYADFTQIKDEDSGPSCSLAEALDKQDLFINSTLAQLGCNLLWKMFREAKLEYHGLYLNLSTLKVNPVTV